MNRILLWLPMLLGWPARALPLDFGNLTCSATYHSPGDGVISYDLSNCGIGAIEDDSLIDIPDHTKLFLYLNGNKITQISPRAFAFPHLQLLNLRDNKLSGSKLDSRLFQQCRKLIDLDLSGNDMRGTPEALISGVQLIELKLEKCSLPEVPPFVTSTSQPEMKYLSMGSNHITRLSDSSIFQKLTNLEHLNLSHNEIEYLHDDIFKNLTQLNILDLANNKINHIPRRMLQNMKNFYHLNLNENFIEVVPADAFQGTDIRKLYLKGNRLTYLPANFFSTLHFRPLTEAVTQVSLYNNPWQCGCLNDILTELHRLQIPYKLQARNGETKVCVMMGFKCIRLEAINDSFRY